MTSSGLLEKEIQPSTSLDHSYDSKVNPESVGRTSHEVNTEKLSKELQRERDHVTDDICQDQNEAVNSEQDKEVPSKSLEVECTICSKTFPSKYLFARHLATNSHLQRASTCPKIMLLDES